MSLTLFKESLNKYGLAADTIEDGDTTILSFIISEFKIYFKFIGQGLSGTFCEFLEDLFSNIPMFIFTHLNSFTKNKIKILEKNFVLFESWNSVRFYESLKSIMDFILNLEQVFNSYKKKVIKKYNKYIQDTQGWLAKNSPKKSESLFALWNADEDDYLVDVDESEYNERRLRKPPRGFVPFKVMVSTKSFNMVEVRLMVESEKGFRYYSYLVSNDIDFGNMIEVFAHWVSNGGPFGETNHFPSTTKEDRIFKHIQENDS